MLVAVDVNYLDTGAFAAGLLFKDWNSERAESEFSEPCGPVEPYVPGNFYRRELPCILMLLQHRLDKIDTIIVDGYVWLSAGMKPGMGAHLYRILGGSIPVVGVAKNPYQGVVDAHTVFRGRSRRPLYVTAVGTDVRAAARNVERMHGAFRIPTMLRRVDSLSREPAAQS